MKNLVCSKCFGPVVCTFIEHGFDVRLKTDCTDCQESLYNSEAPVIKERKLDGRFVDLRCLQGITGALGLKLINQPLDKRYQESISRAWAMKKDILPAILASNTTKTLFIFV